MIDLLKNLVDRLEKGYANLNDKENEYNTENERLLEYEKLLDYINCDAKKLNKYEDQKLIVDAINQINSNVDEYNAACYLLDSNNESVINLPQYRNARVYLEMIINYLSSERDKIKGNVLELDSICSDMRLSKKYWGILNNDCPFVEDIDEFVKLLDKENVVLDDRLEIVSYIIKSNVSNYKKEN